jgi:protein-tyrosine phosphatase
VTRIIIASGIVLILLSLASGCSRTSDPVVPDLLRVNAQVLRSGQPPSMAWYHLAAMGVTDVVKLNYDDESLDLGLPDHDIRLHYVPIQPTTALHVEIYQDLFAEPDRSTLGEIRRIVESMEAHPTRTWLVHCSNGRDRSGLVVGMIRVLVDGWSKRRAWQEMLDRGYHPELLGLDRSWWEFQSSERYQ